MTVQWQFTRLGNQKLLRTRSEFCIEKRLKHKKPIPCSGLFVTFTLITEKLTGTVKGNCTEAHFYLASHRLAVIYPWFHVPVFLGTISVLLLLVGFGTVLRLWSVFWVLGVPVDGFRLLRQLITVLVKFDP